MTLGNISPRLNTTSDGTEGTGPVGNTLHGITSTYIHGLHTHYARLRQAQQNDDFFDREGVVFPENDRFSRKSKCNWDGQLLAVMTDAISGDYGQIERDMRLLGAVEAIGAHIQDRNLLPAIPDALIEVARIKNDEQEWFSLLAYLLRSGLGATDSEVLSCLEQAAAAKDKNGWGYSKAARIWLDVRRRMYRSYLGFPEREDDDPRSFILGQYGAMALGNLALMGEMAELSAFACINTAEIERAEGYFDTAATYFYLCGLSNAGRLNELASASASKLTGAAKRRTLSFEQ